MIPLHLAPGSVFLLTIGVFLAHIMEEFPRLPAWASRHFGTMSPAS